MFSHLPQECFVLFCFSKTWRSLLAMSCDHISVRRGCTTGSRQHRLHFSAALHMDGERFTVVFAPFNTTRRKVRVAKENTRITGMRWKNNNKKKPKFQNVLWFKSSLFDMDAQVVTSPARRGVIGRGVAAVSVCVGGEVGRGSYLVTKGSL